MSLSLPVGSRHMSDHRFFHFSVVNGRHMASYPLSRASASCSTTGVSYFLELFFGAFESSSSVKNVEMVADESQEDILLKPEGK